MQPVDHRVAAWLKQFVGELYKVDQELFNEDWARYRITKTLTDQVLRRPCGMLVKKPDFILSSFLSTGCLIRLDGTHSISFKDIPNYTFQ